MCVPACRVLLIRIVLQFRRVIVEGSFIDHASLATNFNIPFDVFQFVYSGGSRYLVHNYVMRVPIVERLSPQYIMLNNAGIS